MKKGARISLLLIVWCIFSTELSFGELKEQEKGLEQKQAHQITFLEKKGQIEAEFNQEKQQLIQEETDLTSKIKVEEERRASLQERLIGMKTALFVIKRIGLAGFFTYFFSFLGLLSQWLFSEYLLNLIFPITLINILLFLLFWKKEFFQKRRWVIIASLAAILILFSLPVFGQNVPQSKGSNHIEYKLDKVNILMKMDDVERSIFKLEEGKRKGRNRINIKRVNISKLYLHPWEEVETRGPEYAYTLGCLYLEKGDFTKAISHFKSVLNYDFRRYSPGPAYLDLFVSLVKFFVDQDNAVYTEQAIEKAMLCMKNSETFIKVAQFLSKKQWTGLSIKVLQAAINQARNPTELLQICTFALKSNFEELASSAIRRATELSRKHTQFLQIAKYSLDNGRMGDAVAVLEKATSSEDASALLDIAQFAVQNKLYNKAFPPLERIIEKHGIEYASKIKVFPSEQLGMSKDLPTPDGVSLTVYLGMLYQKLQRIKDAEMAYEMEVLHELDNIILEGADKEEINANLNTFFYLRQLWDSKGEKDKVSKLDPIYGLLEQKYLDKYKKEHEESLSKLKEYNQELTTIYQKTSADNRESQKENRGFQLEIGLYSLRLLAIFALLIILTVWAIKRSWEEAKGLEQFKTFVFIAKLTEIYGWISCLTIIGIPIGLIFILFGQLMKIIHSQIPVERLFLDAKDQIEVAG